MSGIFPVAQLGAGQLSLVIRPEPHRVPETVSGWVTHGITSVISMLEHEEACELGLLDEEAVCLERGLSFTSFPIPDFTVPDDMSRCRTLAETLAQSARQGDHLAFHCRGTIGRSPMMLASLLVIDNREPGAIWSMIRNARGVEVPDTREQEDWLYRFADQLKTS
ncbi:protein-tyrosine phosphatase family protein [Coralliovum pocilloporae]|uniref:protein-tyrosine phosphatase family protein n=1 Tax=Coralliovum pocilloporae TaxID=3066369 RepID=UPI00330778A1